MTRALLATCLLALPGVAAGAVAPGTLAGRTLISFGCPGPVREGDQSCNPWQVFPNARFAVGTRVFRSDAGGRFTLRLARGRYVVRTLPQPHVRGELRVVATVRSGARTTIVLRFNGFPKMA
jgi:hypothetical protein